MLVRRLAQPLPPAQPLAGPLRAGAPLHSAEPAVGGCVIVRLVNKGYAGRVPEVDLASRTVELTAGNLITTGPGRPELGDPGVSRASLVVVIRASVIETPSRGHAVVTFGGAALTL